MYAIKKERKEMIQELFGLILCMFGKHRWRNYNIGTYCERCDKKGQDLYLDFQKGISLTGFKALRKDNK